MVFFIDDMIDQAADYLNGADLREAEARQKLEARLAEAGLSLQHLAEMPPETALDALRNAGLDPDMLKDSDAKTLLAAVLSRRATD